VSRDAIPDHSPEEVADLLRRLTLLTDEGTTVVVGGQAVHFWAWFFTARAAVLELIPPTSADLDLCGTKDAVVRAAELLEGEPRLPGFDRHTPSAGIVAFTDSEGNHRILDIVTNPHGLQRQGVVTHAVRVDYRPGKAPPVHFRVMNPIHCMQSRVHNVVGLHKDDAHGLRQLEVSIPCAREFLRMLLAEESVEWKPAESAHVDRGSVAPDRPTDTVPPDPLTIRGGLHWSRVSDGPLLQAERLHFGFREAAGIGADASGPAVLAPVDEGL
jgi:hypothetical protein